MPGTGPTGIDQSEYVNAALGVGNPFSSRAKDSEFEWMDRMRILNEAPPVDFDGILVRTGKPVTEDSFLTTSVQISYFSQSDNRAMVAFTVQTDNKDLVFRDMGGLQTAQLNISGRITSVAGRRVGYFEDAVTTTAMATELVEAKDRKSAYQKALPLPPGRYRIDLLVRDTESGAASLQHVGFEVPKYDAAKLSTSTLILAVKLEGLGDQPAVGMFTIGNVKVIPNVSARTTAARQSAGRRGASPGARRARSLARRVLRVDPGPRARPGRAAQAARARRAAAAGRA